MLEFVVPATPTLRALPPRGAEWLHEAKFDGWRIQLHKDGGRFRLYTKNGYDCTRHFGGLGSALAAVPARSCIIDGEVTAFDPLGLLDFNAPHFRTAEDDDIAVWAFDLLFHDGRDVRDLPLVERKDLLMVLIMGAGDDRLRLSDGFDDGVRRRADGAGRCGVEAPRWGVSLRPTVWLDHDEDPGLAQGQQGPLASLRASMRLQSAQMPRWRS